MRLDGHPGKHAKPDDGEGENVGEPDERRRQEEGDVLDETKGVVWGARLNCRLGPRHPGGCARALRRCVFFGQGFLRAAFYHFRRQRFAQETGHSGRFGPGFIVRRAIAGDYDHRQPGASFLDALGHLESAHPRHLDVGEHDVVIFRVELVQRFLRIAGGNYRVALSGKHPVETLADHRVVVNYQNFA